MTDEGHGTRRRREILETAADLSTCEGLDALSFSRIASEVGLTKAGVAAHFESKEALQVAVVNAAARRYAAPIVEATGRSEPGLSRLRALASAWFEHLDSVDYRGGCFFASAGLVFAGRPGPVRDALAEHTQGLILLLEEQAGLAYRLGELTSASSPDLLVFQIHALAQEANLRCELLGDEEAFVSARNALSDLLERTSAVEARPSRSETPLAVPASESLTRP